MAQMDINHAKRSWGRRLLDNMRSHPWLYLMILPAIAYFAIFHYAPMYGVIIAFQDYKPLKGISGSAWVGFKHFQTFVQGPFFWRLVRNTLSINIGMLLFGFPLPIIFALMLNEVRSTAFRKVVQTVTYMPHFVSSVVVCGLMVIFCRSDGLLTNVLTFFGLPKTNLLTIESYFQPLYIGMNIWQELGWDSIIYFAALTSVDAALYEAARVDGANRFRCIWHITVPGLMPTYCVMLLMSVAGILSNGMEQYLVFHNAINSDVIQVLDLYVYQMFQSGSTELSIVVGMAKSIIGVVLLFAANGISKAVRGESII